MPPRIVFMGTPAFAVPSLEACLELGEVVAVVTQPDKPAGRGQQLHSSPVKQRALQAKVPVLQPARVRGVDKVTGAASTFAAEIAALRPDVAVVTAYGKILPLDVLSAPKHGSVNVHASLLPRFRGAAPIQWAIASGDAQTGVCLMQMDEGMDTGPVIARASLDIGPDDTSASLHDKLSSLGGQVLRESLPRYLSGALTPVAQPGEGVVMAPMIDRDDGRIDFGKSAAELERRLRAFTPWPGLFTTFAGALLKLPAMRVGQGSGAPGEVLAVGPEGIEVACAQGSLLLTRLQPEGKRVMTAQEFLAARPVQRGSIPFGS